MSAAFRPSLVTRLTMRAFARNASSREDFKDEEDPESPTASVSGPNTPVDYSGTTASGLKGRPTARFSSIELIQRAFSNETPETKCLRQRQLVSIAELRMEMASLASLHAKAARHYKRRYYVLMLPSIFLSIAITAFVGLAAPAGCSSGWWRKITISVMSGVNALITALLAFLKYPQKLDAHDQVRSSVEAAAATSPTQARLRFTQLDQDHRFMLHSQHFAYMPIEEVMKQPKRRVDSLSTPSPRHSTHVQVPRDQGKRHGSDARLPLRVPKKDSGGIRSVGRRADAEAQGTRAPGLPAFFRLTRYATATTPAPPLRLAVASSP